MRHRQRVVLMRPSAGGFRARDGGFTLLELIICIAILAIIAVPLANVAMTFFLDSSTTNARLAQSSELQIVNAFWQQDVSSAGIRAASYDASSKTYPLKRSVNTTLACTLPPGTPVITLAWDQFDVTGTATRIGVAYIAQPSGGVYTLLRAHCTGSLVDSTAVIAHNLSSVPGVSCQGGGVTGCSDPSDNVPTTMSMTITVSDPSGKLPTYATTLTAQRRQT